MNIDHLILLSNVTLGMKTETYKRFLHQRLSPEAKLIGIKGPRGAGKTTLVKQYIEASGYAATEVLYVTADHPRVNVACIKYKKYMMMQECMQSRCHGRIYAPASTAQTRS